MKPPILSELMQYYDGEVEDPVRRREIERWLTQNQEGRDVLASLGGLSAVIRDTHQGNLPEFDISDSVMSAIEREPTPSKVVPISAVKQPTREVAANVNRVRRGSSSRSRPSVVFAGFVVLAAAAASTLWWGTSSWRDRPSAHTFSPISSIPALSEPTAPSPSASTDEEPTAALSGAHVDSVDFGANHSGSVIYVDGSGTAVVWVDEGD
ncbi:MAG: hypothetical protein U0165_10910 [Polyangiaceae bacterium]